jgi:hypothetical protein
MVDSDPGRFYINVLRKGRVIRGYRFSTSVSDLTSATESDDVNEKKELISPENKDIDNVFKNFSRSMLTYLGFVPVTMLIAPFLSSAIVDRQIVELAETKGVKREDLTTSESTIYELGLGHFREFRIRADEAIAAIHASDHFPNVMLIGLISTYDYFLSTILGVILHDKSEIVFGMDNNISYKELMNFSTLDEIRDSIIAAKIEDVIRLSHHAQFDWMEKRFGMELRKNLEIWPTFVEIC